MKQQRKKIPSILYGDNLNEATKAPESEQQLNSKILEITMTIKTHYPELSKYIEEMPITVPDQQKPEVTRGNLKIYYDSLNSILMQYLRGNPEK